MPATHVPPAFVIRQSDRSRPSPTRNVPSSPEAPEFVAVTVEPSKVASEFEEAASATMATAKERILVFIVSPKALSWAWGCTKQGLCQRAILFSFQRVTGNEKSLL